MKLRQLTVEDVRTEIGEIVKQGIDGTLEEHFPVTRHGKVGAVIIPIAEYRRLRKKDGNPTEL
ncbi:hypothetical protein OOJ91_12065 [Micromonospora lupini]|uniref:hypothetical protein n=1 Tax=Micromonospora lupini TaxID=285679 RepID=UPI00225A5367|nr:hypothetical protein [Micromonospora lupini]MCX5066613.1 hypothetical protein [Micromonospora lupini]